MAPLFEPDDRVSEHWRHNSDRRVPAFRNQSLLSQWQISLATFRRAVENYQSAISIRAQSRAQLRASRLNRPPTRLRVVSTSGAARPEPVSPSQDRSGPLAELTRRELEVAELIARGFTNQQIADALVISSGTAANHVAHVLAKLEVSNRTQVAVLVQRRGSPPDWRASAAV
jgi:DNA-binding NarL/FixJ family response regulator